MGQGSRTPIVGRCRASSKAPPRQRQPTPRSRSRSRDPPTALRRRRWQAARPPVRRRPPGTASPTGLFATDGIGVGKSSKLRGEPLAPSRAYRGVIQIIPSGIYPFPLTMSRPRAIGFPFIKTEFSSVESIISNEGHSFDAILVFFLVIY